ncbi:prepilin peptidase [Macrococcus capreoli]|uniref:prepilin peptidase n=1 Tax=Macrococcus capreoli TaxID=2982690 RepID=UPI003EE68FB1
MLLFITGAFIGSFMLCLTYEEWSLLRKSQCESCHHQLNIIDLIPVLSFFIRRGRCHYCGVKLSSKYIISEISTGCALMLIYFNPALDNTLLYTITIILIPLAIYDTERMKIPNFMLLILMLILLIINIHDYYNEMIFFNLTINMMTILYKLLMIILLHFFFFLTNSIGYGDIKLFSILLIFLPIPFFIALFFITYLIGGLACIVFLSYKSNLKRIPLVPFITAAFFVVILLYDAIKKLYFGGFV